MKRNWAEEITKPSIILLVAITCFIIITMDGWRSWRKGANIFTWDTANYYSYLPAMAYNNMSFELDQGGFNKDFLPILPKDSLHIPKTTYGMALMYSPYYALGCKIAINQNDPRDGFSEPFSTSLHWGMIFYGIFGLLLLRNFLVKFFSEKVTTLTLIVLFFGTSLFYYDLSQPEMPHVNLFFLFSAFMLTTYHWHKKQTWFTSILIGFLIGLIALIRPTDIIVGAIFIFWPIADRFDVKDKLKFLGGNYKWLLVMFVMAFLVWLPQMLFWKSRTGQFFYFSYPGERFFWGDPQIINVLFSYRKGLLVYTPLIGLAFIGFFMRYAPLRTPMRVIIVISLLNLYVVSCWWDWFFGGCFAARAFVQHFAYLSIPLAVLLMKVFESNTIHIRSAILKLGFVIVISLGISLNLFQTYQYNNNMIHFSSMTKQNYWLIFGKFKLTEKEQGEWWYLLKEPDYEKLRSGEDRDQ